MKLISADINWHEGLATKPQLMLIVENLPENDEYIYRKLDLGGSILYWGEKDGIVQFFSHDPGNQRGFGGREFTLQLANGDAKTITGPWSSRAGVMNNYFPPCVEVTIKDTTSDYQISFAMAVTLELARKAAEMAGVKLVKVERYTTDIVYEVVK